MARNLAGGWPHAGHIIYLGSHDPQSKRALVGEIHGG